MGGRGTSSGGSPGGASGGTDDVASAEREYATAKAKYEKIKADANTYGKKNLEGGGGYNPHATKLAGAEKAMTAAGSKLVDARMNRDWSKTTTAQKREKWNAEIKAAGAGGRRITSGQVDAIERRLGFRRSELKYHIERHDLKK